MNATPPAQPGTVDADSLREHYREPTDVVLQKQVDRVDEAAAAILRVATLFVLATSSAEGNDASPRGGPPGFVVVLDEQHVAFGDLAGNNRLDSYRNLLEHPDVGMLFFVPGMEETLRVNGRAHLSVEEQVLDRTTIDGRRPKVAVVVEVIECFVHCGKALRRAGLWQPETWREEADRPSPAEALKSALGLDADFDATLIQDNLEAGYQETLWQPGGR